MKATVIQPHYAMDPTEADRCFEANLALLEQCDATSDLIVLPEYCDVPTDVPNAEVYLDCVERFAPRIAEAAAAAARRCNAIVCANYSMRSENGFINTTHVFDRLGNEIGQYKKAHPAPSETKSAVLGGRGMDCAYADVYTPPYVLDIEGVRYGFMTCYDFYMYESFAALARENVNIIIGCSHQRSDPHSALEIIGRFLTYNTNAYLVRASISMGEDSPVCGCSMIVSPKGEMLLNMENRVGIASAEFDPKVGYLKPAGYKGKLQAHHQYIDVGRRPWLYRPAGSMMLPNDKMLAYPRLCAHRGFNAVAPENTMPAFGAAVALGSSEIEFDIWETKDHELVSLHDPVLDRVSDGTGYIWDKTYEALLKLDFGIKKGAAFAGLRIARFEDILKKFACTTIMNIHIKHWEHEGSDPQYERIAKLLHQYDCDKHCYIMTSSDAASTAFHAVAPDIARCVGFDYVTDDFNRIVDRAVAIGAQKVQLFKPYFDESTVEYAHANGLICNVFYADDPEEAKRYFDMGIDCVLTNNYLCIANATDCR